MENRTLIAERRMLLLFVAFSFVFFFVEVYLGHYSRLQLFDHNLILSAALVPFFFSPVGAVVSLMAATRPTPNTMRVLNVTMLASIVIGIGGTYFHVTARIINTADLFNISTWLGNPPAFAPLAFALPGIMGLVATYGIRWLEGRLPERDRYRPTPMKPASQAGKS